MIKVRDSEQRYNDGVIETLCICLRLFILLNQLLNVVKVRNGFQRVFVS